MPDVSVFAVLHAENGVNVPRRRWTLISMTMRDVSSPYVPQDKAIVYCHHASFQILGGDSVSVFDRGLIFAGGSEHVVRNVN